MLPIYIILFSYFPILEEEEAQDFVLKGLCEEFEKMLILRYVIAEDF